MSMTEREYQILEDLYMTRWGNSEKRTNSLMRKCEALYELAKAAYGAPIVELGGHHAGGAIPLAFGTRAGNNLQVFSIDDHVSRKGWAGEPYFHQDKARFLDCVRVANVKVTLVSKSVDDAYNSANRLGFSRISLLFWDLGMKDRLHHDFAKWGPLVNHNGIFAIREGDKGGWRQLGSEAVMRAAIATGKWIEGPQYPRGHLYTLRKK